MTILFLGLLTAHITGFLQLDPISRLELWAYDLRLKTNLQQQKNEQIIIIDIDEKSLSAEGQWPWNRARLAILIDKLFEDYEVSLLGMDIVFAEPDRSSQLEILQLLSRLQSSPEYQIVLEEVQCVFR